ncbi:MAG: glycosyltransferase family A protein [Myxococcota bacterium]
MIDAGLPKVGVVVIGRNEGSQLARGMEALSKEQVPVVYVDSASHDGSPDLVEERHPAVEVVRLRPDRPLGPSLGRNTGFEHLTDSHPEVEYVMFLDGDCEPAPDWLRAGQTFLAQHPDYGIVCGRLRERERERNAYHRLADMEWDGPVGDIRESGGNMMARVETWRDAGGQNPDMPAGEEKEFYRRALGAGWKARRIPDDMAFHDIDMSAFSQWWTRNVRLGHSWSQGAWIHRDPENLRQLASLGLYGLALPSFAFMAALPTLGLSMSSLLAYRRLYRKVREGELEKGRSPEDAQLMAAAVVVGKWAGLVGASKFLFWTLPRGRGGRRA